MFQDKLVYKFSSEIHKQVFLLSKLIHCKIWWH